MLPSRRDTLQFIDARNLTYDVFLRTLFTRECEKLFEIGGTIGKKVALLNRIAFFDDNSAERMYAIFSLFFGRFPSLCACRLR